MKKADCGHDGCHGSTCRLDACQDAVDKIGGRLDKVAPKSDAYGAGGWYVLAPSGRVQAGPFDSELEAKNAREDFEMSGEGHFRVEQRSR